MNKKDIIQGDALKAIGNKRYAGAVLGTGAGKTLLGLKHMARRYTDTSMFLVVAPKKTIFDEWTNQAKEHGFEHLLPHIKFSTYLSISKQQTYYDHVYLDECHNLKEKHGYWLDEYNGPVLGLTGTYPKYKSSEPYRACSQYCPVVFEYNIEDAIGNDMINDYKIYVHLLELGTVQDVQMKKGYMMTEANNYKMWEKILGNATVGNMAMTRIMRMKALQSYKTKVRYAKQLMEQQTAKTLVFTDYANQADEICQYTYHTKNKDSKANLTLFKENKIMHLASVLQLAEGVNIPELEVGIILHSYANEKKLRQKVGRFLRLNPDKKCTMHLLCYNNTVDLEWCKKALADFDKTKIFKYNGKKPNTT